MMRLSGSVGQSDGNNRVVICGNEGAASPVLPVQRDRESSVGAEIADGTFLPAAGEGGEEFQCSRFGEEEHFVDGGGPPHVRIDLERSGASHDSDPHAAVVVVIGEEIFSDAGPGENVETFECGIAVAETRIDVRHVRKGPACLLAESDAEAFVHGAFECAEKVRLTILLNFRAGKDRIEMGLVPMKIVVGECRIDPFRDGSVAVDAVRGNGIQKLLPELVFFLIEFFFPVGVQQICEKLFCNRRIKCVIRGAPENSVFRGMNSFGQFSGEVEGQKTALPCSSLNRKSS